MKRLLILTAFLVLSGAAFAQEDENDRTSVSRADSLRQKRHVGEQGLMIMPGARTMPQGTSSLDFIGIVTFNYVYALTSSTHIGIFTPCRLFRVLNML